MRSRAIFFIIGIIVILAAAAGTYYILKREPKPRAIPEQTEQKETRGIRPIVSEPVISPVLSFGGDFVWYATSEGRIFRQPLKSLESGAEEYILPQPLKSPARVLWQKNGSDFIVEENVGGQSRFRFYGARTESFTDYPPQMRLPQFLPGESDIVYLWVNQSGKIDLKTSNADSTNFRTLTELFRNDYEMAVSPQDNLVVLFSQDTSDPSHLIAVDLATLEFKDLTPKTSIEAVKFSPDGSKLLVAAVKSQGVFLSQSPNMFVYDFETGSSVSLGVNLGADQIAWGPGSKELYAARDLGFGKFSLETGEWSTLYEFKEGESFDPIEILVHPGLPTLFFLDSTTQNLYQVDY